MLKCVQHEVFLFLQHLNVAQQGNADTANSSVRDRKLNFISTSLMSDFPNLKSMLCNKPQSFFPTMEIYVTITDV
jgi:hypothetical protein